jgi:predicted DNA-binding transcriptional regulator YafY
MRTEIPARKQATVGRPRGAFVQAKRMERVRNALEQSPAGITVEELAGHLRCSDRTVRRYLQELQRALDLESFEPAQGEPWRWRIKPSEQSRAVAMRRTHAYALLATKPVFAALRGSALADEVEVVNRELLKVAHRPTKRGVRGEVRSDTRLEERFVHVAPPHRVYPAQAPFIDDLFQAAANLVPVDAALVDAHGAAFETVFHPYALLLREGSVWVIGLAVARKEVLVRPLSAFERVAVRAGSTFSLPNDFEVAAFLDGPFGFADGPADKIVTVDFDAELKEEVRHLVVHASQRVGVSNTSGRVRVRFNVSRLESVVPWVLSYGSRVTVVSPPALIDLVSREAKALVARYTRRGS